MFNPGHNRNKGGDKFSTHVQAKLSWNPRCSGSVLTHETIIRRGYMTAGFLKSWIKDKRIIKIQQQQQQHPAATFITTSL